MPSDDQKAKRIHRNNEPVAHAAKVVRQTLYQHKYTIGAAVVMMLAGSAVMLVQPLFFKLLFDTAIPESDTTLAWRLLVAMVCTPLVAIAFSYVQGHLRVRIGASVTLALRKAILNHLLHVRLDALEKIPRGNIVFRVTRDTGRIGEMYIAQELLPVFFKLDLAGGDADHGFPAECRTRGDFLRRDAGDVPRHPAPVPVFEGNGSPFKRTE